MGKEIDNPGGGDCLFFAFGFGLVAIIRQELCSTPENRERLERLMRFKKEEDNYEDFETWLRSFDCRSYNHARDKQGVDLLRRLLRRCLYKLAKEDLTLGGKFQFEFAEENAQLPASGIKECDDGYQLRFQRKNLDTITITFQQETSLYQVKVVRDDGSQTEFQALREADESNRGYKITMEDDDADNKKYLAAIEDVVLLADHYHKGLKGEEQKGTLKQKICNELKYNTL